MACAPPGKLFVDVISGRSSLGGFIQLTLEQVVTVQSFLVQLKAIGNALHNASCRMLALQVVPVGRPVWRYDENTTMLFIVCRWQGWDRLAESRCATPCRCGTSSSDARHC